MSQDLRFFTTKFTFTPDCLDVCLDDLQYRQLKRTDIGAKVILQCTVAPKQQGGAQVKESTGTEKAKVKRAYTQALGPSVHLQNIEILEIGDQTPQNDTTALPGTKLVISATTLPIHGWGQAVGWRET